MKDELLARLAELPRKSPPAELSRKLQIAAHERLVPAKVHLLWSVAIAASVLVYLSWALLYTAPF